MPWKNTVKWIYKCIIYNWFYQQNIFFSLYYKPWLFIKFDEILQLLHYNSIKLFINKKISMEFYYNKSLINKFENLNNIRHSGLCMKIFDE